MQRSKRVIPVSISMPPDLAQRIRVLAAQEGKSRSRFVCEMLERTLPLTNVSSQTQVHALPANTNMTANQQD